MRFAPATRTLFFCLSIASAGVALPERLEQLAAQLGIGHEHISRASGEGRGRIALGGRFAHLAVMNRSAEFAAVLARDARGVATVDDQACDRLAAPGARDAGLVG